jgi:hypothetical protein
MSRHHWYIIIIIDVNPMNNKDGLNIWNHLISPDITVSALRDPKIGQGLISTRWNGWFLFDINLLLLSIMYLVLRTHMIG